MRILAGKVVLLTGASGGLGTYMAQAFAERKVKLALVAHPGIDLEGLRKSVADSGAEAMAMTSDLRDPERRREMLAAVSSRLGPIDILVNNAGVEFTSAYHERTADWRGVEREPGGADDSKPAGFAQMLKHKQGHIVNISSIGRESSGPALQESYAAARSRPGGLRAAAAGPYLGPPG